MEDSTNSKNVSITVTMILVLEDPDDPEDPEMPEDPEDPKLLVELLDAADEVVVALESVVMAFPPPFPFPPPLPKKAELVEAAVAVVS